MLPTIMKVNDVVELDVERMSFGPAAVGRIQVPGEPRPIVIFVEGAAPGEKVRAKLTKNNKSYWEARLVEVIRPSKDRVEPPCPVFGRCGGCQWQHIDYPAQVRAKEEILVHQLDRSTRLGEEFLRSRLTSHPATKPFGYRARLQIHGDRRGIGFFAPNSHSLVTTDHCPIAHPDIQKSWTEFLRRAPLAELSKPTGQFKIEWTRSDTGQIKEALNRKHGAFGFTQVNPEQNQVLVSLVNQLAGSGKLLLDLYGGDGNLSNALVGKFQNIISVDSFNEGTDPAAVKAPLAPGRLFVKEKAEDFLLNLRWRDWGFENADVIVVDPPRSGLREGADRLSRLRSPRVILVSCDPSTLARDLTSFTSDGTYEISTLHLIDMFPQTYHMETVVELKLK